MKHSLLVAAAIALVGASGLAQAPKATAPNGPLGASADTARADGVTIGVAIVVPTEPNSVRVVAIPVPAELKDRAGRFEFTRVGSLVIGGRQTGVFAAADADRPIVLLVNVPTSASAGRMAVGVMRFACGEVCETVDVPVFLEVQARTSLQLEPSRPMVGANAGARIKTDVLVRNTGNATEQVTVSLQMPNNWRARVLVPTPLRMLAGAMSIVPVELSVAGDAEMGDYNVAIQAATADGVAVASSMIVRVGAGQNGAIGWRPILEANAAVARDALGNTATAYGADLSGEIFPDVHADGRASFVQNASDLQSVGQRSLGRLGYSSNRAYLLLAAPHWEGGAGMLGLSNAGLAGTGLWGEGVTARAMNDSWRANALGVRPIDGGHFLLSDASYRLGPVWTGVLVSDLHDDAGIGRSSQTVAGTFDVPWRDGSLQVQAGRRSADTTSGLAWSAQLEKRTRDWSFNALASHTPGGALAFARAENEVQIDGFRKLNSVLSVGANYWNSSNGTSASPTSSTSSGWAASQQVSLGRFGALSFDTHVSTSNGRSTLGDFGNGDREIKASWSGNISSVQTRFGVSRGVLTRSSTIAEDFTIDASATRVAIFGAASLSTNFGSWQVDVANERTGVGVGLPAEQVSAALRLDQMPLVSGRVYLRAELLTYYLGLTNALSASQVVGVDMRIADSYNLTIDAERNDFQRSQTGASPWVLSLKIRRAIGLPALRNASMRGIVYADLNGNGKRDRGERGMPGAIVNVDGVLVTTDAEGRFAVGRSRAALIEVDPRSLPMGWMAGPRPLNAYATGAVELAVIPTAPVQVTIRLGSTEGIDTANVHLENAIVVLTDSAGRKWTGTPNARGEMRFDALPAGVYSIGADISGVGETLVLPAELPTVRVEAGGAMRKVDLPVSARKIRLSPPARIRQLDGGAVPPGGGGGTGGLGQSDAN